MNNNIIRELQRRIKDFFFILRWFYKLNIQLSENYREFVGEYRDWIHLKSSKIFK
jgi:hypothetical protein